MKQLIEVVPMEKTYRRGLMLHHIMIETFDNMATTKDLTQAYSKVESSLELMNGQAQSEMALGRIKEVFFLCSALATIYLKTHMLIYDIN